ncbi:GNAT superfamily N-acetyltransferase [Deinococcus sp. HSC-46F16]|uniref:GNAT family N-acetyltransferase n=1 Tax=Deinococcus sp. HSC-46F16 TaxID=2910968 RepID=UPI00209F26E2|nr:GNAT family N-acetyltransferase [Deinococcus sp. HSC-46F16]MCP2015342.1 GNAT superfamily N-acetyltransferase [Deinococcus sp. HSC-46F16]
MSLSVTPASGEALRAALPDLARLRTEVFRDFPYLYDGTPEYEERYLQTYLEAPGALALLVRDGTEVVGASTALPLVAETGEIQRPFLGSEFDPGEVLYLGESVLRSGYRGRGLGHRFFDEREAHARRLGLPVTAFCAVQRPADHPARPADYRPLNTFWQARGYVERPDLETTLSWPDVGETRDTPKPMRFWVKRLD